MNHPLPLIVPAGRRRSFLGLAIDSCGHLCLSADLVGRAVLVCRLRHDLVVRAAVGIHPGHRLPRGTCFIGLIELRSVIFVHFVTDDIAEHCADCGTDQGCLGIATDGLTGNGAACRLEPHEIAFKLLQDHGAPSLTARPATFADLVTPSTNQSAQALLLRQSSSSEATFTLVALQNRVAVLHELKELPELNPQGGKYAALLGDIRKVAGQTIFPHLWELQDANSRTAHRASSPVAQYAALEKGKTVGRYASRGEQLGDELQLRLDPGEFERHDDLCLPVIDTGENGVFTKGEFEVMGVNDLADPVAMAGAFAEALLREQHDGFTTRVYQESDNAFRIDLAPAEPVQQQE